MNTLLNAEREPDMSVPTKVIGVDVEKVIVPPPDPDYVRMAVTRAREHTQREATFAAKTATWSIEKSLALCEV